MDSQIATMNEDDRLAFISYIDQETGNVLAQDQLMGKAGQKINYQSHDKLAKLKANGYLLAYNGFGAVNYTENNEKNQVFAIILKHARKKISYAEAKQYSIDSATDDYLREHQLTINFVNDDNETLRPAITEKATWSRSFIFDEVTKHATVDKDSSWVNNDTDYQAVSLPVISGYFTDNATLPAQSIVDDDVEDTVTYHALGRIIPIQPNGQNVPGAEVTQYHNDSDDPTRVAAQTVPQVDGFTTNRRTVTPTDPGQDTYVVYTASTSRASKQPVKSNNDSTEDKQASATKPHDKSEQFQFEVRYIDKAGNELAAPYVQVSHWNSNGDHDIKRYDNVNVPVIEGYYANEETVTGQLAVPFNLSHTVIYQPFGKIIPIDEDGKRISGVPTESLQNDPKNPTEARNGQPVPEISGYAHERQVVNPANPGKDIKVVYQKEG